MRSLLRRLSSCSLACALALFVAAPSPAAETDPFPPQLSITYDFAPGPLPQFHRTNLVYEMFISNFSTNDYTLDSLTATIGSQHFTYSGQRLVRMLRTEGSTEQFSGSNAVVASKTTVIAYVTLSLANVAQLGPAIANSFVVRDAANGLHTVTPAPLAVNVGETSIVGAPLRGANWLAGDASHNGSFEGELDAPLDAAHRRTVLIENGTAYLAQRYAIDYVKYELIGGVGETYAGDISKNASYFCYDQPIVSVAPGRVVDVLDGVPENVPNSGTFATPINFVNAGGNHVVVDIGGGRYAFYAHMIPGSPTVRVGSVVATGTVLGRVGNSGSSTEPHLHFHIVDGPSFIGANGLPYGIDRFRGSGPNQSFGRPNGTQYFPHIGAEQPLIFSYPANNAAIAF